MSERRRAWTRAFWRVVNPLVLRLAGSAATPWWIVLETRGRRSGRLRRVPLARGPVTGGEMWITAAHGRRSGYVANLLADPRVRVRLRGRWHDGRAEVLPLTPDRVRAFNLYARMGLLAAGSDPVLVRVALAEPSPPAAAR
jgi:deazaflavin-dependent oxidoreductase (nitroreductase family)